MGQVCSRRAPTWLVPDPWVLVQDLPVDVQQQVGAFVLPSRAKLRWIKATQYILRILRIRRRWGLTGQYLQQPRIQDLVDGIDRDRQGRVRRHRPARRGRYVIP